MPTRDLVRDGSFERVHTSALFHMSNPTTIEDLRKLLDSAGVQPGRYVIQELGEGDVEGIGFLEGSWCTYFSERGSYNGIRRYPTEAAAIDAFLATLRPIFASKGITIP